MGVEEIFWLVNLLVFLTRDGTALYKMLVCYNEKFFIHQHGGKSRLLLGVTHKRGIIFWFLSRTIPLLYSYVIYQNPDCNLLMSCNTKQAADKV